VGRYFKLQIPIATLLQESDRVVACYVGIFARVLLENSPFFFAFFQKLGRQNLILLLEVWLEKVCVGSDI
jgi:hypothetical protein